MRAHRPAVVLAVLTLLLVTACSRGGDGVDTAATADPSPSSTPSPSPSPSEAAIATEAPTERDESGPTTETTLLRDPVENAFTVEVPKGWDNLAYSAGEFDVHREVVISVSPDGGTVLFMGDPKVPQYWSPDSTNPFVHQFADMFDYMELKAYSPAPEYFREYARQEYGELPKFAITGVEPNDSVVTSFRQKAVEAGLPESDVHAVTLRFKHADGGKAKSGLLIGLTANFGEFWITDVSGISSEGDADDYLPMLKAMTRSHKTNPKWTERQAARHEQIMAQIQARTEEMTRQHNANMAWIQDSSQAHQQRMQAIWSANDASVANFHERMASSDNSHRQFLNYINDEHTVVDSSGEQFQVDDGYDRYFMNVNDNTYVGGDINFDDRALLSLGLNPSDYEEVAIKK